MGPGDFEAQARQVFSNLKTVLEAAGASFGSVVTMTMYLTDMTKIYEAAQVRDEFINLAKPPGFTGVEVSSLALPELMVEVDAIAVL